MENALAFAELVVSNLGSLIAREIASDGAEKHLSEQDWWLTTQLWYIDYAHLVGDSREVAIEESWTIPQSCEYRRVPQMSPWLPPSARCHFFGTSAVTVADRKGYRDTDAQ